MVLTSRALPSRIFAPRLQGEALRPEQLAAEESLVAPPVQRLLRRLGLGWLPAAGGLAGVQVAVAPKLSSLVSHLRRLLGKQLPCYLRGSCFGLLATALHRSICRSWFLEAVHHPVAAQQAQPFCLPTCSVPCSARCCAPPLLCSAEPHPAAAGGCRAAAQCRRPSSRWPAIPSCRCAASRQPGGRSGGSAASAAGGRPFRSAGGLLCGADAGMGCTAAAAGSCLAGARPGSIGRC